MACYDLMADVISVWLKNDSTLWLKCFQPYHQGFLLEISVQGCIFFYKYTGSKQITYIVFSSLFINVFIVWAKAGVLGLSLTRPASLPLSHLICVSWRVLSIKTIYCKLVVNNVKWSFSEHKTPTVRPAPHTAR